LGQTSLCNDIAVRPHGSAYVTDSHNAQILRLKPGTKELEVWATGDRWKVEGAQHGIAVLNNLVKGGFMGPVTVTQVGNVAYDGYAA
jgi:hypothetical protein